MRKVIWKGHKVAEAVPQVDQQERYFTRENAAVMAEALILLHERGGTCWWINIRVVQGYVADLGQGF